MMIDRCIELLYYALFFLAPLIMSSVTSELFEFNKMIFIYGITILVLFFWILKMILHKSIILKKTLFDIPLLLFLGSQVASTIISIDRHTSLYGYYGRFNGGLLSIMSYTILYFAFTAHFFNGDPMKTIKKMLKVSLFSSFVVILWGLPGKLGYDLSCLLFTGQWNNSCWTDQFHPDLRMFSTLGQPNWLGAYLAIHFFVAVYFLLKELFSTQNIKSPLMFLYGYLFLNFSSILFTRSRSALVSVIGGLILLVLFLGLYFKNNLKTIRTKFLSLIILLTFIILPIILFKTGFQKVDNVLRLSFMQKQEVSIQPTQSIGQKIIISESLDIRKVVWKGAIDLANRFPLFGSGVETFAYAYYFVRPIAHNLTSEWDYLYNKAHNEYLNYLATTGYVGLGIYLTMILSFIGLMLKAIYGAYKSEKKEHVFLFASLLLSYISILITNFFGFSTTTINLFFYFLPAVVAVLHFMKAEKKLEAQVINTSLSLSQWIRIGIIGIVTIVFLVSAINYYVADVTYAQADNASKTGNYQLSANLLTKALKMRYEHVYEDKLSNVLANLAVVASYQKQQDLSRQIIELSDTYNRKSLQASSKNVLYWKTRAKNEYLYYQVTLDPMKIEKGVLALSEARALSPTDPKIPYSLSIFYSLLFDEQKDKGQKEALRAKSLQEVKLAISLKPDYRESYLLKAQLLKKYGRIDEAKQALEFILQKLNPSDEEVKKELQSL